MEVFSLKKMSIILFSKKYIYLYIFTLFIIRSNCIPRKYGSANTTEIATNKSKAFEKNVLYHLINYGYLSEKNISTDSNKDSMFTEQEIETALKDYQDFMKLPITGTIDEKTLKHMNKSRCGIKDKIPDLRVKMFLTSHGKRKRRYIENTHTKPLFYTRKYYYTVDSKPKYCCVKSLYHQLEYAFNMWAGVSNIVFIRRDNMETNIDISIGFYEGDHQDEAKFDGEGGYIAHASASERSIHFDSAEKWNSFKDGDQFRWLHPEGGMDFIQCAMHEIGHVLGLKHITDMKSAMYPTLQKAPSWTEYSLSKNDVSLIQALYGKCAPPRFDAIFTNKWKDGKTYIIIGPFIYQFNDATRSVEQTWPRSTTFHWAGRTFVDEVFWNNDGFMYWFVDDDYFAYSVSQTVSTERRKIGKNSPLLDEFGWEGLREPYVDAALVIKEGHEEIPYIFRKNLVYKMITNNNEKRLHLPFQVVAPGWPKNISNIFPGIPDDLDTAFTWGYDGNVYFFKGRYFQIWDPNSEKNTRTLYEISQWQNVCDVYKCQMEPIESIYKCESWAYTKSDLPRF